MGSIITSKVTFHKRLRDLATPPTNSPSQRSAATRTCSDPPTIHDALVPRTILRSASSRSFLASNCAFLEALVLGLKLRILSLKLRIHGLEPRILGLELRHGGLELSQPPLGFSTRRP